MVSHVDGVLEVVQHVRDAVVRVGLVPGDGRLGANQADEVLEVEAAAERDADGALDGARVPGVGRVDVGVPVVVGGYLALREAAAGGGVGGGRVGGGADGGQGGDAVVVVVVEVVAGSEDGAGDDDGRGPHGGEGCDLLLVAGPLGGVSEGRGRVEGREGGWGGWTS